MVPPQCLGVWLGRGSNASRSQSSRLENQHTVLGHYCQPQPPGNIRLQLRLFTAAFLLQAKIADTTGPPLSGCWPVLDLCGINANETLLCVSPPSSIYVVFGPRATFLRLCDFLGADHLAFVAARLKYLGTETLSRPNAGRAGLTLLAFTFD
jgi:hypothetical protein